MAVFQNILDTLNSHLGGASWFLILLLGTGLFFTILLKFPQLRLFHYSIQILRGKFDRKGAKGDTSHFQSLTTALSGTVGTGNIAGVAFAIHLGGPAALFWMIVTALIGMTTKFVEVTLSHKYREFEKDGSVSGGPMYYMKKGLGLRWLAVLFAVATVICSFGTGNMPQIASITDAMEAVFGMDEMLVGALLSVLLALVILGGIKRIAKVTEKLVPLMAVIYFISALVVVFYNVEHIVPSLRAIVGDVFTGTAATGGFLGSSIAFAISRGVNRGLFSNEAGQGSAPIVHAAAQTDEPVAEGLVALLEPFIDTIIICMLTGLVILCSGAWSDKVENTFHYSDLRVLDGIYHDEDPKDRELLLSFLNDESGCPAYDGTLLVADGSIQTPDITLFHARSVCEEVFVNKGGKPFTGEVIVKDGQVINKGEVVFRGRSLVHSTQLTTVAFSRSGLADWGGRIVAIGILLFAFSTAISWSYYGTRAMAYLFGLKYNRYYLVVYVLAFFIASFTDTSIVWGFSEVAIVLMTIPNLIAILLLTGKMRTELKRFLAKYGK